MENAHEHPFGPESFTATPTDNPQRTWLERDLPDGKVNELGLGKEEVGYLYRTIQVDERRKSSFAWAPITRFVFG